jgi:hypothetical protein
MRYTSNLGSGFFAGGTIAPDVEEQVNAGMMEVEQQTAGLPAQERYTTRLKASPKVWSDAIAGSAAQQSIGARPEQYARAQAESVMFTNPFGRTTPWSPGRIAAAMVLEPGTEPFKYASGFGDFTAQIFLDPMNYLGLWWAKAGRAGRLLWSVADETEQAMQGIRKIPLAFMTPEELRLASRGQMALPGSRPMQALPMTAGEQTRLLDDPGREVLGQLRLTVGDEAAGAIGPGRPDAIATPWYLDETESASRVIGPKDPPKWYIEAQRRFRTRFSRTTAELLGAPREKLGAGRYVIRSQDETIEITKSGRKWQATGLGPEAGTSPEFNTLKEAEAWARKQTTARYKDPLVGGMTHEEFLESGDDLWLGEEFVSAWREKRAGRGHDTPKLTGYRRNQPAGGNAKSRVYGRTLDLTSGAVDDLPEGAQAALRADHKLRSGRYQGFGDTALDGRFDNTIAWMRENGYGKLRFDDDNYLVVDEFIGGNIDDPLGRVWFDRGDRPIENAQQFGMADEGVTPNQINGLIDLMVSPGRRDPDADQLTDVLEVGPARMERTLADEVAATRAEMGPRSSTMEAVRPTVDHARLTHELQGKRASKFAAHLFARSKAAGQADIHALDRLLRIFDKKNLNVPRSVRNALFDAKSEDEAARIFATWMGSPRGPSQAVLPGGFKYGRLGALDDLVNNALTNSLPARLGTSMIEKPWLARRMSAMLPTEPLNMVDDPDRAYYMLDRILTNFNVKRGSGKIVAIGDDGVEIATRDIEDIMTDLRNLAPGEKARAYDIMGDYSEYLMASLVDQGVDPSLARAAKGWWRNVQGEALYDAERLGRIDLNNGTGDLINVGEDLVHIGGPQLTSEAWDGTLHFPNRNEIRRIANETDALGRTLNSASSKYVMSDDLGRATLEERTWYRFANTAMQDIWKPLVLLRGAWTIRIAIDDQMRVAAEGLDSVFSHPFRLIGYAMTNNNRKWKRNWAEGFIDVHGQRIWKDNISELDHALYYRGSLMHQSDEAIGTGSYGYQTWRRVERGKPGYNSGLADDHLFLGADPITKSMAGSTADDPIEEAVSWLLGKGPRRGRNQGVQLREELARTQRNETLANKILEGDHDTIYNVLSGHYARLHRKTGGRVLLDNGDGKLLDYSTLHAVDETEASGAAKWVIAERGDEDLLTVIASGKYNGKAVNSIDTRNEYIRFLTRKTGSEPARYPDFVSAPNMDTFGAAGKGPGATMDKARRTFFDWFMGKPSDRLSRSPVFKQAYWRAIAERVPYMSDELLMDIQKAAKKANIDLDQLRRGMPKLEGVSGQLNDLNQLDRFAKAAGMTQVESTLFDLVNKKNISESLNLIMPFAEAWGEFISRWGRLMVYGDRNLRNANRLRQGVNGARSSGFFYENDFGEEVFNYPAFLTKAQIGVHNTLNNLPVVGGAMGGDVPLDYADQIQSTGRVQGMNFAAGVIPGFGPVFQQAAKHILPDDPGWDWARNMIAPFGMEGGLVGSMAPAWLKRIGSAMGGLEDPQLTYTYTSTVQDVLRTMMDRGEFAGVTNTNDVNALVRKAEDRAKGLLMVRAAATYWQPTSPSYTWQKEDVHGMVWSYSNLGNEYRKISQEVGGDDIAAFDEFERRFGFLPTVFTRGRTYQTMPRTLTTEGYRFEREQADLFIRYPSTAMFLDPTLGEPQTYDHGVMLKRLQNAEAEAWTGEQYTMLMQDQLGDLMWDNAKRLTIDVSDSKKRDAMLVEARSEIEALYPSWRQTIPGKRAGVTNEEQREEIQGWLNDPAIMGTSIGQSVAAYEAARSEALAVLATEGLTTIDGSKKNPNAVKIRAGLRLFAEELGSEDPAFTALWRNVYMDEVGSDLDDVRPEPTLSTDESIFGPDFFGETLGVSILGS